MEEDNTDLKRKSLLESSEEPPDKKMCHDGSIEEILAPSEERNKDLSAHSIQQVVVNRSSSKIDISQEDNDNPTITSDNVINNTSNYEDKSEADGVAENNGDPDEESAPPLPTHSSVEEVTGIRLSRIISTDKLLNEKPLNKDNKIDEKKIKWKCDRHFSNHGTQSTVPITVTTPIANTADPQTSTSSITPLRNRCAYGFKCYRKSSGHKAKYAHPGDSDYDIKDDRPECRYGIKCYRKDPKHKQDFKHTVIRCKRAQTPVRAARPEAYESGTDHSSVEESVDESEYDPSGLDCSTDDDDDNYDDNSDW